MNKLVSPPTINDYLSAPVHHLRKTGGRRITVRSVFDSNLPLVTIFTIVLNSNAQLLQTIESVLGQSYPNFEYIIIDGGSTDGTLELIKEFNERVDLWISEPDQGTADASNKAVSLAQGKFIFWLSAGDWIESDYIGIAVQALLNSSADFVFGNITSYKDGNIDYVVKGDKDYAINKYVSPLTQQNFATWVMKTDCFRKAGLLDLEYQTCCDFEWGLRIRSHGLMGFYEGRLNLHFLGGGISSKYYMRSFFEALRAMKKHGQPTLIATAVVLFAIARTMTRRLLQVLIPPYIYKRLIHLFRRNRTVSHD